MMKTDDLSRRRLFNQVAQDYAAARPEYPEQVFADILTSAQIPPDRRLLEIGCGPGQATLPFARRGYHILCLDIGADLLALAAQRLRDYPNVQFENSSFEDWPVQEGRFDLVYAASAWHWVPPDIGYAKAAQALKPGGALAIISNQHPRPMVGFFADVQTAYRQHAPDLADKRSHSAEEEIEEQAETMRATGLFETVEVRSYSWTKTYTTAEYLRLMNTYSSHRALEEGVRSRLYQAVGELIERKYDGKVERPYLTVVYLGKKGDTK